MRLNVIRAALLSLSLTLGLCQHLQAQSSDELIDTVLGFLADPDPEVQAIALDQIRGEVTGSDATKRFAAALPSLDQKAQLGLLQALGQRGDVTAKPAVLDLLDSQSDPAIRAAAISTLGKLGDASDCIRLVRGLRDPEPVAAAARRGLVVLRGDHVTAEIVRQISGAAIAEQVVLIDILTERRALDAIPVLLEFAVGADATLRQAAMRSLGQLAGPEHVPSLIKAVLAAEPGNERNAAERNLMFVCQRIEDPAQRAKPVLSALKMLSVDDKTALLPVLGRIGGEAALREIQQAISSRDASIHLAGIRGISNWPDAAVSDDVIDIAKRDPHPDHRRIARMTLLRIAPLPDGRSDAEKLALLQTAMQLAANDQERAYGLQRAAAIRLVETLRYVMPYVDHPSLANAACQTVVELAHDRQLRDDNKAEFDAALDKVIAITSDEVLIDRAQRYKKGQTWVRPK
jgi:HEAT repeat protein